MFNMHLMNDDEKQFYADKLTRMNDEDFVDEIASVALEASHEINHSRYDQQIQLCFTEASRREAMHLYQRGYNRHLAQTGQDVDPAEIAAAGPRKAA